MTRATLAIGTLLLIAAPAGATECQGKGTDSDRLAYAAVVGGVVSELRRVSYFEWRGKNCRDWFPSEFPEDAKKHLRTGDVSWALAARAQIEAASHGKPGSPDVEVSELALREIGAPELVDEGFVKTTEAQRDEHAHAEAQALMPIDELVSAEASAPKGVQLREWILRHRSIAPARLFRPDAIESVRAPRRPTTSAVRRALEDWMASSSNTGEQCEGKLWAAELVGPAAGGAGQVATCWRKMPNRVPPSPAGWAWLAREHPGEFKLSESLAGWNEIGDVATAQGFENDAHQARVARAKSSAWVYAQPTGSVIEWLPEGTRVLAQSAEEMGLGLTEEARETLNPKEWIHVQWLDPRGKSLFRRSGWMMKSTLAFRR